MKLFFFLLFISFQIIAQVEYSQGIVPPGEYPGFFIDAANYKGASPERTRIDVYFQIPYANLQFIKYQNKFRAKYSVTLTIYDEDKDKIINEKIWNGKIIVNNFDDASSGNNFKFGFKSFELPPNDYVLTCILYDKDSKKEYAVEAKLEVRDFNKPINFSDIFLISSEIDSQIVLNISNAITSSDSSLFFFYEMYSDKEGTINLEYLVENNYLTMSKVISGGKAVVYIVKKPLIFNNNQYKARHWFIERRVARDVTVVNFLKKRRILWNR